MRRWLVSLSLFFALSSPLGVYAKSGDSSADNAAREVVTTTTINNDFLNTERDIGECVGNSAEQPGCGREPTSASDRGGWLQYLTLAVMAGGLSFIFWRVARAVRARDAALNTQVDRR